MSSRVRQAIERLENELAVQMEGTTSTGFAQFLDDIRVVIDHIKKAKRRKRV